MNGKLVVYILLLIHFFEKEHLNASNQAHPKNFSNETIEVLKPLEIRRLILNTIEDINKAKALQKYFNLRNDCYVERLNEFDGSQDLNKTLTKLNSTSKYCPFTSDFLLCFPPTQPNKTIYFKCPYKKDLAIKNPNELVSRYCQPNGTWEETKYFSCIKNVIKSVHPIGCVVKNKTSRNESQEFIECENQTIINKRKEFDKRIYTIMICCNLIGFCITIISVSIAIFIFLSIRSLRCVRNMIHCNMLFTFVVKCTGHIGFFWMMIEAVYLITVIVAAYSSNKIKLWWYLIIGWIFPIIPIIPYSILTFYSSETSCSWIKPNYASVNELLIDVPIYILLAINFILLIIILYVIVSKLRNHNDVTKFSQYKKLSRAALVLFPLFGLTFAVFFWLPSDANTLFSKIYYFVNIFLQTSQGVWVSFVYCFLNDEVKNTVKNKIRSWRISHIGSIALGTSSRHHSIPTLYSTQLTSKDTSIIRSRQDSSNPSRLPILVEDAF